MLGQRDPGTTAVPAPHDRARTAQPTVPPIMIAATVIALFVQTPPTIVLGTATDQPAYWTVLKAVLAAVSALALLAAGRFPGPTVAVVAAAVLAMAFVPPAIGPPSLALGFALIAAIVWAAPAWAVVSAGAIWLADATVVAIQIPDHAAPRIIAGAVALAACFGIGTGIRTRRSRAARRAHELAERARAAEQEERTAIARELHDVLAHSLSQIAVQSGMGLHLFDRDPEAARGALADIRLLASTGLDEARGALATLRGEAAPLSPEPQLADLPGLIAGHRALGLDITPQDRASAASQETAPSATAQAAAVRIAREALTNVLRHSSADRALVTLERDDADFVLTVTDDGVGLPAGEAVAAGGGTEPFARGGVRSMRERAELAGGTLTIDASPSGPGTRVTARLPWDAVTGAAGARPVSKEDS